VLFLNWRGITFVVFSIGHRQQDKNKCLGSRNLYRKIKLEIRNMATSRHRA